MAKTGIWIQHLSTEEPDESKIEVEIAEVEAVFDWKKYLFDEFGYEVDETRMDDYQPEPEE